ncbi:MAG: DNA-directed RNA polymerase, subunit D [halophilic archaeon J07HX64]|jgi:DNA-directed RNA polymerase, subunit D (EC 2.7.7.6)|nr:MAG: DNA-directed RNA polymerase, subunit D [halophilic archaeon J07HX64]
MEYEVQFVERNERDARFVARPMTPAFANGIRRAMLADVPTFSIDDVRVIENSSVMFDEQIGLRLGLVPLVTPPGEFEHGEEVTLSLDVSGPARESPDETRTAYSGDIVCSDPMVEPADQNVPIIDLKADQRLQFEADAVLDVGREHAKHQGGVAVGYRHLQRVTDAGERGEFDDDDPHIVRGVIEDHAPEHAEGDASEGDLVATEAFDHTLRNRYPGRKLDVTDVEDAFVFHVETDGSLTADQLVEQAVGSLKSRGQELREAVQL